MPETEVCSEFFTFQETIENWLLVFYWFCLARARRRRQRLPHRRAHSAGPHNKESPQMTPSPIERRTRLERIALLSAAVAASALASTAAHATTCQPWNASTAYV